MASVERWVGINLLAAIVRGLDRATIATIFTSTIPTLRKKGNPYWDKANKRWLIRKQAHSRVFLNGTYAGAVNTRRHKECTTDVLPVNFESQGRAWGQRLPRLGSAHRKGKRASIVSHEGQLYLDVQVLQVLTITYVGIDGAEIPATALASFIPARKKSNTQDLNNEVTWRDYHLTNVRQLRMQGQVFNVRLDSDAVASQQRKAA